MTTTVSSSTSATTPRTVRPDLNAAARRVAAAYGLTLGHRQNRAEGGEPMDYLWSLKDTVTGFDWELNLVCLPILWGQEGWVGSIRLQRYGNPYYPLDKDFIGYGERVYGRKACQLTRARFVEWAETLEPGSLVDKVKPKKPKR